MANVIIAKQEGLCFLCGRKYPIGTRIVKDTKTQKWVEADCLWPSKSHALPRAAAAAPKAAPKPEAQPAAKSAASPMEAQGRTLAGVSSPDAPPGLPKEQKDIVAVVDLRQQLAEKIVLKNNPGIMDYPEAFYALKTETFKQLYGTWVTG